MIYRCFYNLDSLRLISMKIWSSLTLSQALWSILKWEIRSMQMMSNERLENLRWDSLRSRISHVICAHTAHSLSLWDLAKNEIWSQYHLFVMNWCWIRHICLTELNIWFSRQLSVFLKNVVSNWCEYLNYQRSIDETVSKHWNRTDEYVSCIQ